MNKISDTLLQKFSEIKCEKIINIDRSKVVDFYKDLRTALFLNYYDKNPTSEKIDFYLEKSKKDLIESLQNYDIQLDDILTNFYSKILDIREALLDDVEAIYNGDPACTSCSEIVLTYPGFVAISAYRIAHELYLLGLKATARIISEYAHSRTGIDISPGAQIGRHFFIDHGTGIVIGETCIIKDNVKIYQGVTLGALSLREGRKLVNQKRHPTIEENVTIYSGVSIFGGNTIIGHDSTIGSGSQITASIPPYSIVKSKPVDIEISKKL